MENLIINEEPKVFGFKLDENIEYLYEYKLIKSEVTNSYSIQIKLLDNEFINKRRDNYCDFTQSLPINKITLMNLIGAWARFSVWEYSTRNYKFKDSYGFDDFRCPTKDVLLKKHKSYSYLRSRKIGCVLGGKIYKDWLDKISVSEEEMKEILRLSFRINPRQKGRGDCLALDILFKIRLQNNELWPIIKSDFSKYNVSLCKWILNRLPVRCSKDVTLEEYNNIIKNTPDVVRKCRYGFEWDDDQVRAVIGTNPQNRWQWFALRASISNRATRYFNNDGERRQERFLNGLITSNISLWHYYKKYQHIEAPYSFQRINHMIQIVWDGIRQYDSNKDSDSSIAFVPVEGSPMRMLRGAIYNHRQDQKLNKIRKLHSPDFNMPIPSVPFPKWIEDIRIKTAHQMIEAGVECEHCIGGYTHSNDLFVREENVCAQIDRDKLEVVQCYDYKDTITKKSQSLMKRLNKDLKPLLELIPA